MQSQYDTGHDLSRFLCLKTVELSKGPGRELGSGNGLKHDGPPRPSRQLQPKLPGEQDP